MKMSKILVCFFLMVTNVHAMMPVVDAGAIVQLVTQVSLLKKEVEYIALELKNLDSYHWSNAQPLINRLGDIAAQQNSLAYSAGNLDRKFKEAYPGYVAPMDYSTQYKNNTNMTLNTLNSVLQSLSFNARDFVGENQRLKFLQQQAQSAQGQTQAIQASAQIASEMVSQMQLLRQTMIAEANSQMAYFATQTQNEGSARAEIEKVIAAGSQNVPRYGMSGHSLNPPNF